MAGASMNDIKSRIKSVRSTMQITKAMELVATSKLRRAKERAEGVRPYYEALSGVVSGLLSHSELSRAYREGEREIKNTLFIVIAGDRGLAGGYNSNVFRLATELAKSEPAATYLPIGKRACEYYRHLGVDVFADGGYADDAGVGECFDLSMVVFSAYSSGSIISRASCIGALISTIPKIPTIA